jgi:hypothetical protein
MSYMLPPQTRHPRRTTLIAAAVAVILAAGLGAWLLGRDHGRHASSPTRRSPTTGAAGEPSSPASSGPDQSSSGPDRWRWIRTNGVRLPTSSVHGPSDTAGGRARGFSHDELGAALAAVDLDYLSSPLPGPAVFNPTITQQGAGDVYGELADVQAQYERRISAEGKRDGDPLSPPGVQVLGYRVTDGDPRGGRVVIEVCGQGPVPGQSRSTFYTADHTMVWTNGDWRLSFPVPDPVMADSAGGCTPLPGA